MSKLQIFGIVLLVLVALGYAYYLLIVKPAQTGLKEGDACIDINGQSGIYTNGACVSNGGNGNTNNGNGASAPADEAPPYQLGTGSLKVNASDVSTEAMVNTFSNNVNEGNASSFHILTSPRSPRPFIHYEVGFSSGQCPQYIWHTNSYYTFLGTTTNGSVKTCYYKFDKAVLPNQLKVQVLLPPYQCANFKYYLSGIEYIYSNTILQGSGVGLTKYYCIYNKV